MIIIQSKKNYIDVIAGEIINKFYNKKIFIDGVLNTSITDEPYNIITFQNNTFSLVTNIINCYIIDAKIIKHELLLNVYKKSEMLNKMGIFYKSSEYVTEHTLIKKISNISTNNIEIIHNDIPYVELSKINSILILNCVIYDPNSHLSPDPTSKYLIKSHENILFTFELDSTYNYSNNAPHIFRSIYKSPFTSYNIYKKLILINDYARFDVEREFHRKSSTNNLMLSSDCIKNVCYHNNYDMDILLQIRDNDLLEKCNTTDNLKNIRCFITNLPLYKTCYCVTIKNRTKLIENISEKQLVEIILENKYKNIFINSSNKLSEELLKFMRNRFNIYKGNINNNCLNINNSQTENKSYTQINFENLSKKNLLIISYDIIYDNPKIILLHQHYINSEYYYSLTKFKSITGCTNINTYTTLLNNTLEESMHLSDLTGRFRTEFLNLYNNQPNNIIVVKNNAECLNLAIKNINHIGIFKQ